MENVRNKKEIYVEPTGLIGNSRNSKMQKQNYSLNLIKRLWLLLSRGPPKRISREGFNVFCLINHFRYSAYSKTAQICRCIQLV